MLAVSVDESAHERLLAREDLVFERKYDGIRALVEVTPSAGGRGADARGEPEVRIWSRLGNDKTAQFPEIAEGLAALAAGLRGPVVLDGEIVAVDAGGRALPFERIQGRMHRRGRPHPSAAPDTAAVLMAFDLIRDGREDLRPRPLTERRARLVDRLDPEPGGAVRVVPSRRGGGADLRDEALAGDWEGLIAKDPASRYLSGRRNPAWRKLKLVRRQEFVVGGWTEGRSSRSGFGALLVGYYPGGTPATPPPRARAASGRAAASGRPRGADRLIYAGHVGSGFTQTDLDAIGGHLHAIAADESPFTAVPPANETPHWVEPSLVVEVKFTRWTVDEVLRHPVYLGVRADTAPRDVRREDDRARRAPAGAGTAADPPGVRRAQDSAPDGTSAADPPGVRPAPAGTSAPSPPGVRRAPDPASAGTSAADPPGARRAPDPAPAGTSAADPSGARRALDSAPAGISAADLPGVHRAPDPAPAGISAADLPGVHRAPDPAPAGISAADPPGARRAPDSAPAGISAADPPGARRAPDPAGTSAAGPPRARRAAGPPRAHRASDSARGGISTDGLPRARGGSDRPPPGDAAGPARAARARPGGSRPSSRSARAPAPTPAPLPPEPVADPAIDALCDQLRALESGRKRGTLVLPDGSQVPVGNLHKVFWPEPGLTKGDLVRFNLRMSPFLLPVVADRPLVMKRFPNGVDGKWFYQHRSPDELPEGVRVVTVSESLEREDTGVPYLIGGTLQTLAWMAQLAVISQDPWFSRLPDIAEADWVALDLDPMPEAPFSRVVEVARWLHDELVRLGAPCLAKTSGASGLHIYIPLPPGTPYEAGMIFCQIVATIVASRHPRAATVERMVKRRAADAVYIDYLQNIYGKTLAAAYSARASPFAGVSTPLTWDEVHDGLKTGLSPRDFTLGNIFDRLAEVGDLWAELRSGAPADLRAALAGLEAG